MDSARVASSPSAPSPRHRRRNDRASRWRAILVALMAAVALTMPLALAPVVQAVEDCGPEDNAIVCENSKPGDHWSDWEIQGAGDASIQGFATDMSVNAGSRIDFKIDTDAADYDVDIYRTGWYQGLGARKVASVDPSATLPQNQPECLWDLDTEFLDCGTWAVSASWQVPADAVSGVYLAKLTREDTGGASHITFVVRNDGSTSDVLFQTSDTTWHAYNSYGGSNFYWGGANMRAYKLSYNRPFATRGGIEARDFYFGAEYPMVRFMERNGYDVSYFSGVDTDRFGDQLTNHKTFLSVGHDEYWSGQQRQNVEAARDAGVNLQFLSGNEMYWRVRYESSPADPSGDDHRTMVSYKETWSNDKIDPTSEWTGTFRDPRFASPQDGGGVPENTTTGTAYVVNYGDMPVTVDSREGDLRLWRNTGLEDLPSGTSEELAPHTVGYESNEDLPNGFRPPGLIRLSTTTGQVPEYLQDFGNTVAPGETTHHVTLYRAESGALVFSAGSVQWTWGLDEWHDGDGAPADVRMQQAQVNLFADMGVQPSTLMDGLVASTASTDTTAPTVQVTTEPTAPVPHGEQVTVSGTATDGTGPGAGTVAGVEYSVNAGSTWEPAQGTTDWTFSYPQQGLDEHTVLVRAIDDSGNFPRDTAGAAKVTTAVEGPYSAFGQREPDLPDTGDPSGVELGLRFTPTIDGIVTGARFYRAAAPDSGHAASLWTLGGDRLATAVAPTGGATGWQTAQFPEPVQVSAGTEYVVSYTAPDGRYAADANDFSYRGVEGGPVSVAGGFGVPSAGVYAQPGEYPAASWQQSNYFVDAVFVPADEVPLSAGSRVPADTAVSVPVDTPISAVLSRDVDPASVSMGVTAGPDAAAVGGSTAYDAASRTATFTPTGPLAGGTDHTVTLKATDTEGSPIARGAEWSFRTWQTDTGACPCGLLAETVLPDVPVIDDGSPLTLGTAFTTDQPGLVTAVEFYRAPGNAGPHTGSLFTADGTSLATVEFPSGSVSGWQQAELDAPVRLEPGKEYIVAYSTPGPYSVTVGHWSQPRTSGPLRTAVDAGRFVYGGSFPDQSIATNYLVDVRFSPDPAAPSIADQTPAPGAVDVALDSTISIGFDQPVAVEARLSVAAGQTPVPGTSALSSDGTTVVFTPQAPLPQGTELTATAENVRDAGGVSAPQDHTWSFRTTYTAGATASFLAEDAVPQSLDSGDPLSVQLGLSLTTDRQITVHALRYYRGSEPGSGGTGHVWGANGTELASVEFGTGASPGWHTAFLDTPVTLPAGATFTISRHAPQGGYVHTTGEFAAPRTNGALTLSGDNGRFRYGDPTAAPAEVWNNTNYFVDLMYVEDGREPMTAGSHHPEADAADVPVDTTITAVLSRDADPDAVAITVTAGPGALAVPGATTYDAASRTVSFTPSQDLAGGTDHAVVLSAEADGSPLSSGAEWSFRTSFADGTLSLLGDEAVPQTLDADDDSPVELGVQLKTSKAITVQAIRYYRGTEPGASGAGSLWAANGTRLATVSFPRAKRGGWQTAVLQTPVQLSADTTFTVSRHAPDGGYAYTSGGYATPVVRGALTTVGDNGRFRYGGGGVAPTSTWGNTNYYVDLLYTED